MAGEESRRPAGGNPDPMLGQEIRNRLAAQLDQAKAFAQPESKTPAGGAAASELEAPGRSTIFHRISRLEVATFLRQFATLFGIGIPVLRALQILSKHASNPRIGGMVRAIGADVEEGGTVSESMAKFPRIFNQFIVSSVRAGETGGTMDQTLNLIADYIEKDNRMRRRLRSALSYPLITMCVAGIVVVLLLTKVLPAFVKAYAEANVILPWPTRLLLHVESFIIHQGFFLVALFVLAVILYRILKKSDNWAAYFDHIKLRFPFFGRQMVARMITYRFARLMSVMIRSGVPVHQALDITAGALGNEHVSRKMRQANELVQSGERINIAFRQFHVLPEMFHDILGVGEETGALQEVLTRSAQSYEEELEELFDNLAVILEPLMLLLIGGVVAIVALSMFLPYFQLGGVILPH